MNEDPLVHPLAMALDQLVTFVAARPSSATEDDDIRALEDVAVALRAAPERERLAALLSTDNAEALGLV